MLSNTEDEEITKPREGDEGIIEILREFMIAENLYDNLKHKLLTLCYQFFADEYAFYAKTNIKIVKGWLEEALPSSYLKRDGTTINLYEYNYLFRKYQGVREDRRFDFNNI